MTATSTVVPLLVFEAADCLMAIPHPRSRTWRGQTRFLRKSKVATAFDLGEYFDGRESDGPWLHWGRGTRNAWLRVRRVIDVVPIALSGLTRDARAVAADRRLHARIPRRRRPRQRCVSATGSGAIDGLMKPIDTSIFVGKFVEEARDRLKALGAALLRLEQTPGAAGRDCRSACARRTASRARR